MKPSGILQKRLAHRGSKRKEERLWARLIQGRLSSGPAKIWIDTGINGIS